MIKSREIRLKSRPVGMPTVDNFELVTVSVPDPAPDEVQVKNLWMSVDPYMRGRMVDRASYGQSSRLGQAHQERATGEVAVSNSTMFGWRPHFQLGAGHGLSRTEAACRTLQERLRAHEIAELRHRDTAKREGGRVITQANPFQYAEEVTRGESARRSRD